MHRGANDEPTLPPHVLTTQSSSSHEDVPASNAYDPAAPLGHCRDQRRPTPPLPDRFGGEPLVLDFAVSDCASTPLRLWASESNARRNLADGTPSVVRFPEPRQLMTLSPVTAAWRAACRRQAWPICLPKDKSYYFGPMLRPSRFRRQVAGKLDLWFSRTKRPPLTSASLWSEI